MRGQSEQVYLCIIDLLTRYICVAVYTIHVPMRYGAGTGTVYCALYTVVYCIHVLICTVVRLYWSVDLLAPGPPYWSW